MSLFAGFALVAGACGNKKDEGSTKAAEPAVTEAAAAPEATLPDAPAPTEAQAEPEAPEATEAPEVTDPPATDPPATEAPALEPILGGKLVIAGEAEVANPWTPKAMQCDSYCQMRARSVFEPLVAVDEDLVPEGFLAESVTPNDDYTVWTVKVREGITFHDGEPLNADAAMYNLNDAGGGILVSAAIKDVAKDPACWKADAGVLGNSACKLVMEKVDDMTFTIATGLDGNAAEPLPWPGFVYYFTGQWAFMASPKWLESIKTDATQPSALASQPVGTGPFVYDSYAPGDKLIVKKNPNYWHKDANGNALPYLDEIEFRVIADAAARGDALRAGQVDMIAQVDVVTNSEYLETDEFPYVEQSDFAETNYILLRLNKEGHPLSDQRVRCALLQGLDKEDLIETLAGGLANPANGPFSPGQEGNMDDNGALPFDPDAASAAIEAYEAETGEDVVIKFSTTTSSSALAIAEYIQESWTAIGVDVEVVQIEQSKLINNALFGDPEFEAFGWRNHGGLFPDQQYYWWHSSAALPDGSLALNFGRLQDPVIDDLLERGRTEADAAERKSLAEQLNQQFAKECWIIPTYYTRWLIVHHPHVVNIGAFNMPDGSGTVRDGAGFAGQVWTATLFRNDG